jgi:hypothetical protein
MLGVASERVFTGLAHSVVEALGSTADNLRKALDNPRGSQHSRFLELRKRLEPIRSQLPERAGWSLVLTSNRAPQKAPPTTRTPPLGTKV